ncbi:MAG: glycoside hydrolase family 16 protein [Actinomycetia bacterium]|nr:glycoside hydrolase family 16 protein [Actinomycetes bacterium]
MPRLSRRTLLLTAGAAGAAALAGAEPALADANDYAKDITVQGGQSVDAAQAVTLGADQTATSTFTVDLAALDAPLYSSVYVRAATSRGGNRYSASLVNRSGLAVLELVRVVDQASTVLGKSASAPLSQLPGGEAEWTMTLTATGPALTAQARCGQVTLTVEARDEAVPDGTWVVQSFYLGKSGSSATVRRTHLTQTSSGGRKDGVDRSQTFSRLIFSDDFSSGANVDPGRWAEMVDRTSPYRHIDSISYLAYDWGVVNVTAHDVAGGCARLWWRVRRNPDGSLNPVTNWPNSTDQANKVATQRFYDEGYITTEDTHGADALKGFVYGKVEARVRFPQDVEGLWGGVWMRPNDRSVGGEIDIAEAYGGGDATGVVGATVHFSQTDGSRKRPQDVLPRPDLSGFHTYAVEKTPGRITFFFDGTRFHEVLRDHEPQLFDQCFGPGTEYHLRINAQTGCKSWDQRPDPATLEKACLEVDYVRVWAMD